MFRNLNLPSLGVTGRQSELIEWTLSYGFKGFDLDLAEFERQVQSQGLARARRLIDSARLKLGSFELPVNLLSDEESFRADLAKTAPLVEMAAGVGCRRARTTLDPAGDIRPYHESFELCRRRCGEIAAVLAPHEVRLGIGFVAPAGYRRDRAFQFIHTFDALVMLAKTAGAANVGIVLDVWHWHVSGGTFEQIQALAGRDVVAVDISDATTAAADDNVDESTRVLPGENGTIDVTAILTALSAAGFDGPVTPRPHPRRFAEMRREDIVKLAAEAMNKVWESAGLGKSSARSAVPGVA